jgi:hypothetical protein
LSSASNSRMFVLQKNRQKEALMNIITLSKNSHLKSAVSALKSSDGLPFQSSLSQEEISDMTTDIDYRNRYNFYPPEIVVWLFLSQKLENGTMDSTVAKLIALLASQGKETPSSNTAAYSQALSKLPEELLSNLARSSAKNIEEELPDSWMFQNRPLKLIDGTTLSMPDTDENQATYPQPDTQEEGLGFPIARIVTVSSFASGMVLDLAFGPYSGKQTGEHALLRQLLHNFDKGDIAIADSYYTSFFLIAYFMMAGVDFIFPMHAARNYDFRTGERLGKKDHTVEWVKPVKPEWMTQGEYSDFPDKILVRELEIVKTRKGYRDEKMVLVTSFTDNKAVPKDTLNILYSYRWFVELDLRSIKQTMNMDILKGRTPKAVGKEIWCCILAYNLIRKTMAQAAVIHNKNPRELSFTHALNLIKAFRDKMIFSEKNEFSYGILLKVIAQIKVGSRPNRREPRAVKRRPKAFPRMQKPRHKYNYKKAA